MQATLPSRNELEQLISDPPTPCVSISIPTHPTGRETRQDPIRLKNHLREAVQRLGSMGCSEQEVESLLEPASKLPDSVAAPFWRNGSESLLLLLAEGFSRCYKLPIDGPEVTQVGDHFFLSPLVRYLQGDGAMYIVAVSQKNVRLLSGTKHGVSELELEALPEDLRDALNIDEYQSTLQFHSHADSPNANGEAIFHGHGGGEGEDQKQELLEYFHRLDNALAPLLNASGAPLVFAGVDYLFPIFQKACKYKQLQPEAVTGSPDGMSDQQLHKAAWAIAEPAYQSKLDDALERFGFASSRDKATDDIDDILPATQEGRVETLLLSTDFVERHGKSEPVRLDAKQFGKPSIGMVEAHDLAAAQTLQTDGNVFVLDTGTMPTDSSIAAIFRY